MSASLATAKRADRVTKVANTFVQIADDSPSRAGSVPPRTGGRDTIASIQYALLAERPYQYTLDDLIYEVHVRHRDVRISDQAQAAELRAELLSRGHPCMRASPLTKKYGWGVHYDAQGRIAIYPVESDEYRSFSAADDGQTKVFKAVRSARA